MNVLLVMLLGWLMMGLEVGLKDTLSVRLVLGSGGGGLVGAPSFVVPLAIFVALCAPPLPALWTCLALGAFLDLTSPQPTATGMLTVLGPHALGLLVAGQFVVLVRAVLIRRHPLTLAALSIVGGATLHIVATAIFTGRKVIGDPIIFDPTGELLSGLLSALLTGGTALALSLVFMPLSPLLGLSAVHGGGGRFGRR
jgi:hypothetical protein